MKLQAEFDDLDAEYQGSEVEDADFEYSDGDDEQTVPLDASLSIGTTEEEVHQLPNSIVSNESVDIESSFDDQEEKTAVERFIVETCKCQTGPGKTACSSQLSRETVELTKNNCRQVTREQLDLVIMAQVNALRTIASKKFL